MYVYMYTGYIQYMSKQDCASEFCIYFSKVWKESSANLLYLKIKIISKVGWLVKFNVALGHRSGLLPTVWESSLKILQRYVIIILIHHGGDSTPALVPSEVHFLWEFRGHCTHD